MTNPPDSKSPEGSDRQSLLFLEESISPFSPSFPPELLRHTVLLVDDNLTNLMFGKIALSDTYEVYTVPSAAGMFQLLKGGLWPSLILLDIDMPEMDGREAMKILKGSSEYSDIPVIFLTALNTPENELDGLSLGAVDYITKPIEPNLLRKRVEMHLLMESQRKILERQKLELQNFNLNLVRMVKEKTFKVMELQRAILDTVADLVESRDDITGGHVGRTRRWLNILVEALVESGIYRNSMRDWDIELLLQSSQLHDVGKITITDAILLKKGKLTEEEFNAIKQHTTFGVKIIDRMASVTSEKAFLEHAKIFAGTHHEKWDGSGYPDGLKGEKIPLQGRLMAIADVYDALTSDRPYKDAFSHEDAVQILSEGRGSHFDPNLIDIFMRIEESFKKEPHVFADGGLGL
jgi:putative two-component system response regulator